MKVKTDIPDRYGRYPLRVSGMKSLKELNNYLWQNYQGFKFAIVFDESKDEFEELEPEVLVYFLDTLVEEVAEYSDCKIIKK